MYDYLQKNEHFGLTNTQVHVLANGFIINKIELEDLSEVEVIKSRLKHNWFWHLLYGGGILLMGLADLFLNITKSIQGSSHLGSNYYLGLISIFGGAVYLWLNFKKEDIAIFKTKRKIRRVRMGVIGTDGKKRKSFCEFFQNRHIHIEQYEK